jgi:hypothetical protein
MNGSYTKAILQKDTWVFKDLALNNSQALRYLGFTDIQSIEDLNFSSKDSNITIRAYLSFNYTLPVNLLSYFADGSGQQSINFCLNSTHADPGEWSVIVKDNVFLAEGDGWTLMPDNTVVIDGATGNVTIVHYDFGASDYADVFFVLQHSVLIVTCVLVVVMVGVAVVIQFRRRKAAERNSGKP